MSSKTARCLGLLFIVGTFAQAQTAEVLPQAPINATQQDCVDLVRRFQEIQMKQWDDMKACMREQHFGTCPNDAGGQEDSAYVQCCPLARQQKQTNKAMDQETRACFERSNSQSNSSEANSASAADWNDAGSHKSDNTSGDKLATPSWRSAADQIPKGAAISYKSSEGFAERDRLASKRGMFRLTPEEADILKRFVQTDLMMLELEGSNKGFAKLSEQLAKWAGPAAGPLDIVFGLDRCRYRSGTKGD